MLKFMTGFNLDNSIGYQIERTEQCMKRELRRTFNQHGFNITPYQWIILYRLWQQEGLTQAEIADHTIRDKPTITRMIDVMEKHGLLVRRNDHNDRRAYKIYLTDSGRQLKEKLPMIVASHIEKACEGISSKELEITFDTLAKICRNFESSSEQK